MKRMRYYRDRRRRSYWQIGCRLYEDNDEFARDMDLIDLKLNDTKGNIRRKTITKIIYRKWGIPKRYAK